MDDGEVSCMLPLEPYDPGDVGNPQLPSSRAVPRALELNTVREFFADPAEPNYTWI